MKPRHPASSGIQLTFQRLALAWVIAASSLCGYSPQNQTASLAMNLAGIASYATDWVFVDAFKVARPWISQRPGQPWGDGGPLDLDSEGWVQSFDGNQYAETVMLDGVPGRPAGTYTVLFEGEGTFSWAGSVQTATADGPGRIRLQVGPEGGIWMRLLTVNPQNPVRRVRVIMPGFEDSYLEHPFHPLFLELWRPFRLFRFMDWLHTNNSTVRHWSDRTLPTSQSMRHGVPWEYIIQLCNTLRSDAWICIPHLATDDYVRKAAILLRSGVDMGDVDVSGVEGVDWALSQGTVVCAPLHPELRVYVEYSNEVWNGIFQQSQYAQTQGVALGLAPPETPWTALQPFYSRRSVEIFRLFSTVFGGTQRVERVMAWQTGSGTTALDFENAYLETDAFAIAPYFGGYLGNPATQETVARWSPDQVLDACETHIHRVMDTVRWHSRQTSQRGLRLIAYEGGQHLVGYSGAENNDALTQLLITANRSPRMRQLYLTYHHLWKSAGGQDFAVFSSMGHPSKWGSWGILEHHGEPYFSKPKYLAVHQFMETNPVWWEDALPPSPPAAPLILSFQASDLPQTVTQARSWTHLETDGVVTGRRIDWLSAPEGRLFLTPGYPAGEFSGGFLLDYAPNPLAGRPQGFSLSRSTARFSANADGGQTPQSPSTMVGVFLWRSDQFLDPTARTVGRIALNLLGSVFGDVRFVVRDGDRYFISSAASQSSGLFEIDLFNNSGSPDRQWLEWHPTATGFHPPSSAVGFAPQSFDDVREVGFAVISTRSQYGHTIAWDRFQAWARSPEEFTVSVAPAAGQADPTAHEPVQFDIQFSEPPIGFGPSAIRLEGSARPSSFAVHPLSETLFRVSVSGINLSGSVILSVPAGSCTNASGHGNQASTGISPIVRFNVSNPPTVTVNQAPNQADPTAASPIFFLVVFSEPVSGFDASGVLLQGTAGATTASVSELSPSNGTTYQVSVSGMERSGSVTLSVPAGVAFNALGAGNSASTYTDNTVLYDTSRPPHPTINRHPDQSSPTLESPVVFLARFDQPVVGFGNSGVLLSGTAQPASSFVTELPPHDGTTFRVAVTGMSGPGTVTASIPEAVCLGLLEGLPNRASTSHDAVVHYRPGPPASGLLVSFDGTLVPDGASLSRPFSASPDGAHTLIPFSERSEDALFNTPYTGARFAGGARYLPSPGGNFQLRTNDTGHAPNRFSSYFDRGAGNPVRHEFLFVWPKDLFGEDFHRIPVGFSSDSSVSFLKIRVTSIAGDQALGRALRFVVRDGDTWYLSEFVASSSGLHTLSGFNSSSTAGNRWAVFHPSAEDFALPPSPGPFSAVDFRDVRAVGFACVGHRAEYGMAFEFDLFEAGGVTAELPRPEVPPTVGLELAPDHLQIAIPTESGRLYSLQSSHDLESWIETGQSILGNGMVRIFTAPTSSGPGNPVYYRIRFHGSPSGGD